MIKALNIATQGLLQAEKRATDIAKDILKTTNDSASFTFEKPIGDNNTTQPTSQPSGTTTNNLNGSGFGNLVQQFSDLRAEEAAFKASATAFKKIDETLGTLLDDEG